jgi:hypothetical protein
MRKLPPWDVASEPVTAKGKRDQKWMIRWVNDRLDDMLSQEEMNDFTLEEIEEKTRGMVWDEATIRAVVKADAIREAEVYGNMAPMAALIDPDFVKFLQRPKKLRKGDRFKQRKPEGRQDPVAEAVADVKRIHFIWKYFYKKQNRRQGMLTAEELAAARWDVTVSEIASRKSHKSSR